MSKFTSRLKDTPTLSSAPNMAGSVPSNGQAPNGVSIDLKAKTTKSNFHHTSNETSQVKPAPGLQSQHGMQPDMTGSRTEKVVANFLQSPLFQDETKMDIRDVVCTKTLPQISNLHYIYCTIMGCPYASRC